jgi:hypothetical protein
VLNWTLCHEDVWWSLGIAPYVLNLDTGWSEWSASSCIRFILGTHWVGGSVGYRVGLDTAAKRNISAPVGNRSPVVQPYSVYAADWVSPAPRHACFVTLWCKTVIENCKISGSHGVEYEGSDVCTASIVRAIFSSVMEALCTSEA